SVSAKHACKNFRRLGRYCAILAPPAGVRSEFRHAQVMLLDSKISNSVQIAARSSKNRKGDVRKNTGDLAIDDQRGCSNWAKLVPCRLALLRALVYGRDGGGIAER